MSVAIVQYISYFFATSFTLCRSLFPLIHSFALIKLIIIHEMCIRLPWTMAVRFYLKLSVLLVPYTIFIVYFMRWELHLPQTEYVYRAVARIGNKDNLMLLVFMFHVKEHILFVQKMKLGRATKWWDGNPLKLCT